MLLRGLASASNGMQALIEQNDSTANNIANVNTVGYKKANLIFEDIYDSTVAEKTQTGDVQSVGELSVGSRVQKLAYDFSQGALDRTGTPFDVAIEGDGFFKIQKADGSMAYTRNGSFAMNSQGYLVTKEGENVLDTSSKRIKILTDGMKMHSSNDIVINERGQVTINNENNQSVQQTIGIFDFQNKEDLTCVGASQFKPTDATTNKELKAEKFSVQQGALEMSNANVVNEMIRTINTSRNYESLSKLVQSDNESLKTAIRVGRISG